MRARKQDCWQATVRISIPIDAAKPETIAEAQRKVRELATLIPGSSVEITHAGFGRMAVPPQTILRTDPETGKVPLADVVAVMAEIQSQVQPQDGLEPPASLRRVPRQVNSGPDDYQRQGHDL